MIKVTLKDGVVKEFEPGISDALSQECMGLYKAACAVRINGEAKDLRTTVSEGLHHGYFDLRLTRRASTLSGTRLPTLWHRQSSTFILKRISASARRWKTAGIMMWAERLRSRRSSSRPSKPR